ncbi:MAG: hypothetical protein H7Z72_01730 [Bacteroidetes bacterium]|nr:hypothetical protein [Fibrella sp.]
MKTNQRIEEEVEKTLQSIDGIQRATPNPFFLARVQARLDRRHAPESARNWVLSPAWVVASLGLILVLNLSAVAYVYDRVDRHEQDQEAAGLSAEWGLEPTLDW